MNAAKFLKVVSASVVSCHGIHLAFAQATGTPRPPVSTQAAVTLSPFVVEEEMDQGYYASQTLAGGRMRQDIKNIGSSIQVVTKEFMEDLGVTSIEELFQYTTSTEVGGILGNYSGATDGGAGEVSTGDARRNPDGTSRVRGLAAPDRARNFFKTDIPFDAYNTDRIDINRGANSFLFGLGSPAGLLNTGLAKARFRNGGEVSTRIGSGGKNPSYRGSFNFDRVLLPQRLAFHGAFLTDRTQYRQQPTFENDDRQYGAIAFRPFKSADTVIHAHYEHGRIRGNSPDVLLPQENLSSFLYDPVVGRLSINAYDNLQRFNHVEGPTQAQYNRLSAAEKARYVVRNTPDANSLGTNAWGAGAYGLVYDGTAGAHAAFAYTDIYRAVDYQARDPFFAPGRNGGGQPYNVYHGNISEIKGTGWLDQGFTDLETFDFSRANLGWDNDYYRRDFQNANIALEQVLWEGKGGFEVAFDVQRLDRSDFTSFNGANSRVRFDINETLWLPRDPNYLQSGDATPLPNPNYGRPFVLFKPSRRITESERVAYRVTGFVKHDFADTFRKGSRLGRWLGRHTLTALADYNRSDEKVVNWVLNSFGDPEPALHIGAANARQTSNDVRNTPIVAYIGPAQLDAFGNPAFNLNSFALTPARYQLLPPDGFTTKKLSWNLGPEATPANLGLDARTNGNERFVEGTYTPQWVPAKNYRLERNEVTSFALNTQSFFWRDLLVVNLGLRHDTVDTWLNTEAPLLGLDEIADVSSEGFTLADGVKSRLTSTIFGGGGVLNWPRHLIKLPRGLKLAFHYNTSKNFIPAANRVDELRRPVPSPTGRSKDYGVSVYLWDSKLVARLNWYEANLNGASSNVSDLFNQTNTNIFNHFGNLNRDLGRYDANNDGQIDAAHRDAVEVDPVTGLTEGGLTRDQAVAALYPNLEKARAAREAIRPQLTEALKTAYNYRMAPDGASLTQWAGAVTDTNDITSKGFEAEIVYNPNRSLRFLFNAAQQKTVLTAIAPRLTRLLEDFWLPHLAQFGGLDWNAPVEAVNGNTTQQQINDRLLDYYINKGQEGKPQAEQRKWRFNAVGRYTFQEGRIRGFAIGVAMRWEDKYANGYPIINDARGVILPDVAHPYWAEPETSYDLSFSYRRKIARRYDWTGQLNLRNVQNWNSDRVTTIRTQPDGSPARVRFDPPLQVLLTNTIQF